MSFTKVRQSAGAFSVKLRDDTPYKLTQELTMIDAGFAHLVVLPARVAVHEVDWTALKSLSIYTGVIRGRRSRTELYGAHATIWLGDEDRKGYIENIVNTTSTFQNWVGYLRKGSTGAGTPHLDAGSVEALGGSYTAFQSWESEQITRRDQLYALCEWAGAEFRVNDDLTLDAGTVTHMYGATPTVVLTPTFEGRDGGFTSLRCTFVPDEDVEDWTADVLYGYSGGSAKLAGTHSYLNGLGTDALWQRKLDIDDGKSSLVNAATAASQLTRFQKIRQTLDVATDTEGLMLYVNPGDRIYAWDPDTDVYDLTNRVYFRGELIHPLSLPVDSVTMSASPNLGVYVRRGDGEIFDLSDWYVPDGGGASITVGERPQSLRAALRSRGLTD